MFTTMRLLSEECVHVFSGLIWYMSSMFMGTAVWPSLTLHNIANKKSSEKKWLRPNTTTTTFTATTTTTTTQTSLTLLKRAQRHHNNFNTDSDM